jgi:hypothetical protein
MQSTTHLNEQMQYTFQWQFVVQNHRDQDGARILVVPNHPWEILSPESMTNQGRDVTRGIQPKFVHQFSSADYYELVEH